MSSLWAYRKDMTLPSGKRLMHVMRSEVDCLITTCGRLVPDEKAVHDPAGERVVYCRVCAEREGIERPVTP